MNRSPLRRACLLVLGIALVASAAPGVHAAEREIVIGYVDLKRDPRYGKKRLYARHLTQALGSPYAGAEVALRETRFVGRAIGIRFELERRRAADAKELIAETLALADAGVRYVIVDAPGPLVAALARRTRDRPLLLLNVSAREDELRQGACQAHLLHVIPSHAMLMDALVQYLTSRKWREVLMLQGPRAEDALLGAAFERAARRYGAKITERRPFVLGNDPRARDRNNVALLTAGVDHDVVFVADSDGEFARDVPYQTVKPQLVVGSEGLAAASWHWAWERHGAPQLEKRFEKRAKRPMRGVDWAAWMAVKSVVEAMVRAEGTGFERVRDVLLGPDIVLDGFKGFRMTFRPWSNQLRQPVLLVTHNWVVERAPIRGFLHQHNNLDTLGFDERDSRCEK